MALPGARCPGQPGEELSDSHSDLGLPGDAASDASFEGFPDPQTCPEARISYLQLRLLSSAASGPLASAVGGNVVSVVDRSGVSPPDAISSAASEFRRSSSYGLGCLLPRGSSVVVRRVPSSRRSSTGSLSSQPFAVHRHLEFRLGCFPRRRPHVRLVVSLLFALFDKPPGAPCGPLRGSGVLPLLRHLSVSLFADNTTSLAYLRNQGGTPSSLLNSVAQAILRLCEVNRVRLVPQFIPGRLNVLTDTLSCRSQVLGSQWTLCFPAFRDLLLLWPATIDLFATSLNHRLPVYFSPMEDPQSAGTDVMMVFRLMPSLPSAFSSASSRRSGSLGGWSSRWWLRSGLNTPGFRTFWSFWWLSQCSFHVEGSTQTGSLPSFPPEPPRALSDCV